MKIKHYNSKYFDWQKKIGEFGGEADLFKFKDYIKKSDKVVDFGCGGGYLLRNINCKERLGVEINSSARKVAKENRIDVVSTIGKIPNNWADVIISNHALEHVLDPMTILLKLKTKLKSGGKMIFVVPFERWGSYKENNINMHLFTWAPQNLGNLFKTAGYKVNKVDIIKHFWPPYYWLMYRYLGQKIFDIISKTYCVLYGKIYQVRVVAVKKINK